MATFNRGLLRAQTGDYRGAISDYSKVIAEYPNFMAGYYQRAEARKKIGDHKGAEQDEFKIMKMQIDKRNGVSSGDKRKVTTVRMLRIIPRKTPMEMVGRPVRNPTRTWKIIGKL